MRRSTGLVRQIKFGGSFCGFGEGAPARQAGEAPESFHHLIPYIQTKTSIVTRTTAPYPI